MGTAVRTFQIGVIPFSVLPFDSAVEEILRRAESCVPTAVHFANAYTIALADSDAAYAGLFTRSQAVNLTDGMPVAWVGRRAYGQSSDQWPRVYGPDVMEAVLARDSAVRHYLLGGDERTLETLQHVIARRFPSARVVGAESPPFRPMTPDEIAAQDQRIRDSGAQIVWVGLGTPKQDWEVSRLAAEVSVVAMAVGAAFDFIAGTKPQAPVWMQRTGTEWLYRLASEPRRLTKRYLWGNPRFIRAAVRNPGLSRGVP
ncbi:MAG: glycosyltransferase [Actinobacteria bacterium]|nr:MAG: glycosyltransferase [Actinomycetota bacterium]